MYDIYLFFRWVVLVALLSVLEILKALFLGIILHQIQQKLKKKEMSLNNQDLNTVQQAIQQVYLVKFQYF